jgi:hypothetical protein
MVIDDKTIAINNLINAVQTIERVLGIAPFGVYADLRVRLDILEARINNPYAPAPNVTNPFYIDGYGGVSISVGDGYPTEDRLNGSLYLRRDGYVYEGLYQRRNNLWQLIPTDFWSAGGDLSGGYYSQTVIGLQDRPLVSTMPLDGYHLTWNNIDGYWEPQVGFSAYRDLSGTKTDQTVIGIQGRPVSAITPSDGYALMWQSSSWVPTRLPIVFNPLYESQNIVANRPVSQSVIDNTKIGIVNLASSNLSIGVSGNYSTSVGGYRNTITADYSIIGGGLENSVSEEFASILGGSYNSITKPYSSILGGANNIADGYYASIIGGLSNSVTGHLGSINNGIHNSADGYLSAILSGSNNTASGSLSTVINGVLNQATSGSSTIITGAGNIVSGEYSVVITGTQNTVSGTDSVILLGSSNNVTSQNSSVIGSNNIVTADNSHVFGNSNTINGEFGIADGYGNTVSATYASACGYAAKSRISGQQTYALNYWASVGEAQFSRILLDGYQINGGQFDLTIPGTSANITTENGKAYEMCVRIIVVNTSGTPTCARFIYDILAHQESGTLVLDEIKSTLATDNGTGWTTTITTSTNELIVRVDTATIGADDRRAFATVEWRELSRA